MKVFDAIRLGGRILLAALLLLFSVFLLVGAAVHVGQVGQTRQQQLIFVLAFVLVVAVLLGWAMALMEEAIQNHREARNPPASLQPASGRRPGLWSTLNRLRMALLFLSLSLTMTLLGVDGLIAHSGVGQVLVALLLTVLGVAGLIPGLSLLVNRGYWLWDHGGWKSGPYSQWRGGKRRW